MPEWAANFVDGLAAWLNSVGEMIDSASSSQLWPEDVIEQAAGIIMDRFDLDAEQALEVLRRMSRNTRTQMCVVAEQVVDHNVPVEAVRGLEEDVLGCRRAGGLRATSSRASGIAATKRGAAR